MNAIKHVSHGNRRLLLRQTLQTKGRIARYYSKGGLCSHLETKEHINYVELFASYLGIQTFAHSQRNAHIRPMIDNLNVATIRQNNYGNGVLLGNYGSVRHTFRGKIT